MDGKIAGADLLIVGGWGIFGREYLYLIRGTKIPEIRYACTSSVVRSRRVNFDLFPLRQHNMYIFLNHDETATER